MDQMEWVNHPKLKSMDPKKLTILQQFGNEAKGKSMDNAMITLMGANQALKAANLSFTNEETGLILDVLTENMSPQERSKVNMMRQFMSNKK